MKQIPPIVWQLAGLAAVVGLGIYAVRKLGSGLKDAYSPGGIAYDTGNAVQDAIIPGTDSLGTWLYGLFNDVPDPTAPTPARSSADWMRDYANYPGGAAYPAREGTNPYLPDYVQSYGYSPETGSAYAPAGTSRNTVTRR